MVLFCWCQVQSAVHSTPELDLPILRRGPQSAIHRWDTPGTPGTPAAEADLYFMYMTGTPAAEADDYVNWVGWVGGLVQTASQLQGVVGVTRWVTRWDEMDEMRVLSAIDANHIQLYERINWSWLSDVDS